jgi:hypothetical protein
MTVSIGGGEKIDCFTHCVGEAMTLKIKKKNAAF